MKQLPGLLLCILLFGNAAAQTCKVTAQSLPLKTSPATSAQTVITLKQGQSITLVTETTLGTWVKIAANGKEGYVQKTYLDCTSQVKKTAPPAKKTDNVWVCLGGSAYAYHNNKLCGGLQNCRATITSVTEEQAKTTYGRRPCRKCY